MNHFKPLLVLLCCTLFFTCNKEEVSIADPEIVVEPVIPSGNENYLQMDSDYIFDQETLHTFELRIPAPALEQIDAAPADEAYVAGLLIFEGDTISPVGIRYKGSIGAFVGCLSGPDLWNPMGRKVCTKLSMKVKINWNGSDHTFYGLKKLQFHSQNNDYTQMHERLGYWLFRAMGMPAPRSVHARLMINGEYSGLYALTEQIDGRFTRYNFDDGKGNLYKEIWPLNTNNQPHPEQAYLDNLKTNEDENPSAAIIRTFAQEIADADPDALQSVIIKWMNTEQVLSYAVVDRMIRHDDGPFHWYCEGWQCSNHNYYWYEAPASSTLHLIPWDLDNAFDNIMSNSNPVTPIADLWGEISNNCQPFAYGIWNLQQRSAACDKLTAGWASFTSDYERIKDQFIQGPFSENQVNPLLDSWMEQIRAATIEASQMHDDALDLNSWEAALQDLKNKLDFVRNN